MKYKTVESGIKEATKEEYTPTPKTLKPIQQKEIALDDLLGILFKLDTSIINDTQLRNHAEKGIEMLKNFGKNQNFQSYRIKGILTLLLKHKKIRL